jgi:peptidoglycan/xylan/chitin deacetylase (PgdA/CDA1 family)
MTLLVDSMGTIRWLRQGIVRSDELVAAIRWIDQPQEGRTVYLTFDDFPSARYSDELLDFLRAENVPATFFVLGQNAKLNPRPVLRAHREGHQLGSHSWSHQADKPNHSATDAWFKGNGLPIPNLYRPPGSSKIINRSRDESLAVKVVVDPYDYLRPPRDEFLQRLVQGLKPGAVVQLHAGVDRTLEVLPEWVRAARSQGYRFELLPLTRH